MASLLPFSTSLASGQNLKAWQLRLSMFHRANPEISWTPFDYGFASSKEVDGKLGDRTWNALQSYIDFRFGKGTITTYKNKSGIAHTAMMPYITKALTEDTPYASEDYFAVPYYNQIMGAKIEVPGLQKVKNVQTIPVSCGVPGSQSMSGLGSADGLSWSDQASVFGHTYQGVPNPQIPFQHAYPTRYHGPIFTTPRFGLPFQANPMAVAPFAGLGDLTDPFSQTAAAAIRPVVVAAVREAMPEIEKGLRGTVDDAVSDATVKVAIGGGIVATLLGALIWYRTEK